MIEILAGSLNKLLLLWPSLLVAILIAKAVKIYIKMLTNHYGSELKSIKWLEENSLKTYFLCTLPMLTIYAPMREEVIFRAPLILFFDEVSYSSWIFMFILSAYFAYEHWDSALVDTIRATYGTNVHATDNIEQLVTNFKKTTPEPLREKVVRICTIFILGTICSYLAVKYQSVWPGVAFHAAWNLLWPIFIICVVLIIVFATEGLYKILNKFDDWRINRKHTKEKQQQQKHLERARKQYNRHL